MGATIYGLNPDQVDEYEVKKSRFFDLTEEPPGDMTNLQGVVDSFCEAFDIGEDKVKKEGIWDLVDFYMRFDF